MKAKNVAILESRLGKELAELVARRGGVPFHAPALAELPDLDQKGIGSLVNSLQEKPAKLFVFQTGVGTRALFATTDALGLTSVFKKIVSDGVVAVRGPKPTAALRAQNVRIDRSAAEPYTTREILLSLEDIPLKNERVVIQRHGTVNIELDRALEARGAVVAEIPIYRWSLPADTGPLEKLIGALARGEMHAVVFTNAEQVRNLFAVSRRIDQAAELQNALNATLVASIGPVASAALREAGVKVGLESSPPKLGPLLAALDSALS